MRRLSKISSQSKVFLVLLKPKSPINFFINPKLPCKTSKNITNCRIHHIPSLDTQELHQDTILTNEKDLLFLLFCKSLLYFVQIIICLNFVTMRVLLRWYLNRKRRNNNFLKSSKDPICFKLIVIILFCPPIVKRCINHLFYFWFNLQ